MSDLRFIRMTVLNSDTDHFIISTDIPARFEVSLVGRKGHLQPIIIMHGYTGAEIDMDQEPIVTYDGSVRDEIVSQIKVVG